MRAVLARVIKHDEGLTTAEYAIGTVAAAGLGGVLLKMLTSPQVRDLVWSVFQHALKTFTG